MVDFQVAVRKLFKHELQSVETALVSVETGEMEAISVSIFDRCNEILRDLLDICKHISSIQLSYGILHLRKRLFSGLRDRKLELPSFHIRPFVIVRNQQFYIFSIELLYSLQFHLVSNHPQDIHMPCVGTQMEDILTVTVLLVQVCTFLQEIQHANRTIVKGCVLQKWFFVRVRRLDGLIAENRMKCGDSICIFDLLLFFIAAMHFYTSILREALKN